LDVGRFYKKKVDEHPKLKEELTEEILQETPRGELLYHIPTEMQIGIVYECIIRISVNKEIVKVGIEVTDDTKTENIIISDVMKVTLSESKLEGKNFDIEELSKERQRVRLNELSSLTEWLFNPSCVVQKR